MNALQAIIQQPWMKSLGWTLTHFLWQGTLVALLLVVALWWMRQRKATARYTVACLALAVMAACPLATFLVVNGRAAAPIARQEAVAVIPAMLNTEMAKPEDTIVNQRPSGPMPVTVKQSKSPRIEALMPWAAGLWAVLAMLLAVRLLIGWLLTRKLGSQGLESLDGALRETLARLAERLGVQAPVRLFKSALVEVPMVVGWLRPVILLPAGCLIGLSPSQLEAIIAHELAHIRRHDFLVNLLQSIAETLLFYHPAVWWVSGYIRQEREHCCDDITLQLCGDRVGYAKALASLEEMRAVGNLALAARGGVLLHRVRRVLGLTPAPHASRWRLASAIAALVLIGSIIAYGTKSLAAEPKEKEPSKTGNSSESSELSGPRTEDPATLAAQIKVNTLVQDARLLIEMGKLDDAEVKLKDAVKLDPQHQGAFYYLNYIKEARYSQETRKREIASKDKLLKIEKKWGILPQRDGLSGIDLPSGTNWANLSLGQKRLYGKLDRIVLDEIRYEDVPLSDVIKDLNERSRKQDPEQKGISFIINSAPENQPLSEVDPVTGKPLQSQSTNIIDLNNALIRISKPLQNVRLLDAIDAVTKVSKVPIYYAVEDYGVVISPQPFDQPRLYTRVYKVDAKTVVEKLKREVTEETGDFSVSPIPHQISQNINGLLRNYLERMGVEFPTNQTSRPSEPGGAGAPTPGKQKAIFFNDRTGVLFVRTTAKEFDTIERAVQQLTWKPWRVQIETIVAEIETSGPGFADVDLLLGGVPAVNADTNLSSAKMTLEAQPSGQPDASQPLSALTNHLESAVQSRSMTGILSPSQLDLVLRALKQRRGSDLSILSGITAISGSEAKVDWTQTHPMNPEKADETNGVYYAGSWLDVTPTVSSNHLSVDLKLRATVAEPAHKAGSVTKSDEHASKSQEDATNDSPESRRYFISLKSVPDGQTVVWTGPSIVRPYRMIDKVAVLGDIPMLGRLFRSESSGVQTHRLILFVTATLVDDAGNPIHAPAKEEVAPKGVFPTPP